MTLDDEVRRYWEQHPCGTSPTIVGSVPALTREWFDRIEEHRYGVEPFIHAVAQFTRHHGEKLLEVGVGTGTDFLQWARAGAVCYGVDITAAAVRITRKRQRCYGFPARLACADAEALPFSDETFDVVYSWGVLHHAPDPRQAIREIHRVLRPGGIFLGMMYGRRSVAAFKLWIRHGLLQGRPWRSLADVIWHHMESIGTKAYTLAELGTLFSDFSSFQPAPFLTPYDTDRWPRWLSRLFPNAWGWFVVFRAVR